MSKIEQEIQELLYQYDCDRKEIAEECSEEGLPSYGSTYECRCQAVWRQFYAEDFAALASAASGV